MADISEWSPIDESNTAAPPAGAPENMPTNTVNNTMRAMMGAIRRWYDTTTTQLANFLPLAGGVLTGPVSTTQLQLESNIFALRVDSGHLICDGDSQVAIALYGAAGSQTNIYRNDTHLFEENNAVDLALLNAEGFIHYGKVTAGTQLISQGTLFVVGNGEINGTLAVGGTVFATGFIDTDGFSVIAELKALAARVEALETRGV